MSPQTSRFADFNSLSAEVQDRIIQLQTPGEDRFFFPEPVSVMYLVPVLAAAAWIVYAYTATSQPLWEPWMYYLTCGISMVLFPIAFYGLVRFVLPRISKLKRGYLFTPDDLIRSSGRRIEYCSLKDVDACRYKKDLKELEIWIGSREILLKTDQIDAAEKLDRIFDTWKANAGEGIGPLLNDPAVAYNGTIRMASLGAGICAAIILGFFTGQICDRLNRSFDDRQTWTSADASNSIEEFENYKTRHPDGSFVTSADQRIRDQVARVKDDYLASVAKGADPAAVAALSLLFENAARRPDRSICVHVSEVREIDDKIVSTLHDRLGATVNGYDVTVPASAAEFRKNKVFSDIRVILTGSSNRGAMRFALSDNPEIDAPTIDVNLLIKSEPTYFQLNSFEDGRYISSIYPGTSFIFRVDFKPGSQAAPFHLEYFGQPLKLQSGVFDRRDKENYSFDKLYFSAATDGLDRIVQQTFGFAEKTDGLE